MPLMDITLITHRVHCDLLARANRAVDVLHKRAAILHVAEDVVNLYRATPDRIAFLEMEKVRRNAAAMFADATEEFDSAIKSLETARFREDAERIVGWKWAGLAEIDPAWGRQATREEVA